MNWENHNEWVEFARIGAPILAALIAGAVAICVLDKNMKLGHKNLKQAEKIAEGNTRAAEERDRENWRREQLLEQSAPIFTLLREIALLVSHTVFDAENALRTLPEIEIDKVDKETAYITYMGAIRARAFELLRHRDQIQLICGQDVANYLTEIKEWSLKFALDSYRYERENRNNQPFTEEDKQIRIDKMGVLLSSTNEMSAKIGNPTQVFTRLLREEVGLPPIPTSDRTTAQPEPKSPPAGPSPEPEA